MARRVNLDQESDPFLSTVTREEDVRKERVTKGFASDLGIVMVPEDKMCSLTVDDDNCDDFVEDSPYDDLINFDDRKEEERIKFSVKFRGGLRHPLAISLVRILKRYPLGVDPKILTDVFKDEHKYEIDHRGLKYSSFVQLLQQNPGVFTVLSGRWQTLVFPACWKINHEIENIHRKIFHLLLTLLRIKKSPLPINETSKHLNDMFGLGINVKDWGFEEKWYYQAIVGDWSTGNVEVVKVSSEDKFSEMLVIQLVESTHNSPILNEPSQGSEIFDFTPSPFPQPIEMENENLNSRKGQDNSSSILSSNGSIFGKVFKLDSVADSLKPGLDYVAYPTFLTHPCNFDVILADQSKTASLFGQTMQDSYVKWLTDRSMSKKFPIKEKDAKIGLYVAVKFEGKWRRAKIMSKAEDEYKLLMVDLGLTGYKKLKDLNYLHPNFVDFPEQSFSCRLHLAALQQGFDRDKANKGIWTDGQVKIFTDILLGKFFGITPIQRVKMKRGIVWEVNAFLFDSQDIKFCPNVAEAFISIFTHEPLTIQNTSIQTPPVVSELREDEIVE